MKLSAVIINYKSFGKLNECLRAISIYPPSFSFEIIVVDNNSEQSEQETEFLKKWGGKIIYIKNPRNLGFSKANDLGIKNSHGEYIAILNADVEVMENAFNQAILFLDNHPECGVLGGQLKYPDATIQDSYRSFPNLPDQFIKRIGFLRKQRGLRKRVSHYLMWEKDPDKIEAVDWVVAAFMFIRRKAYDCTPGFDQHYFLFMEDTDLCRQIWKSGFTVIYNPNVKALHNKERLSAGGILDIFRKKTLRIHLLSALKYFWKYKFEPHPRAKR